MNNNNAEAPTAGAAATAATLFVQSPIISIPEYVMGPISALDRAVYDKFGIHYACVQHAGINYWIYVPSLSKVVTALKLYA